MVKEIENKELGIARFKIIGVNGIWTSGKGNEFYRIVLSYDGVHYIKTIIKKGDVVPVVGDYCVVNLTYFKNKWNEPRAIAIEKCDSNGK